MMDIQEAIKHAKDVANKNYSEGMLCHANPDDGKLDACIGCARDHEQLAEWLEELQLYKQLGTLEEVREAVETVKKYEVQYPDDIRNLLEPIKVSSALKSEIMKLEFRKQSKPESISMLDYTIIAALKSVLEHTE